MAKAFKAPIPLPLPPPVTYMLELSEAEAIAVLAVCAKIGGAPEGVRGVFSDTRDSIGSVLGEQLGMTSVHAAKKLHSGGFTNTGNICFVNRRSVDFKPYDK